jgi:general secretion pathway protein D
VKKILLLLALTCTALWAQVPPPPGVPSPIAAPPANPAAEPGVVAIAPKNKFNLSEADLNKVYGKDEINFKEMKIDEFLQIYAETVNRTILRPGTLPAPTITLRNQTPITRREAIQLLDAVLGINGIAMIPVGEKFVKAVPTAEAGMSGGSLEHGEAKDIPELGPYITHVVQLRYTKPSEMIPVIQPFAKIPNSILPIEGNGVLVIRDFSENVKRMLEMIAQVDVSVPAEFVSEVIPIKYALAGDIASALNSLGGGGGGATVGSSGASTSRSTSSRGGSRGGLGGGLGGGMGVQGNQNYPGGANPGGIGTQGGAAAGGTFTDRLRSIISKASATSGGGSGDIQIFGQTKIIADERTNSLLVYATREDMARIKDVISKLDVVLAQVLIESIILGVSADSSLDLGVSAYQAPKSLGDNVVGGGAMANDKDALAAAQDFFSSSSTNAISTLGGLNYFGRFNKDWTVAVKALSSRGKTEVIQRPVIMTTHATPGSFFVGSTVPYVTSSYYGGAYGGGPSSSYQQLRVGIQLTVTPFINPDGIVVMKIDQAIEEIDGSTQIQGVGAVPNTASRTLSADVTVRDRDTIVLGGFVRSSGTKNKSGVPLLKDIPLVGQLFSSTSSSKDRKELLVLMRPTVLKTPDLAAVGSRIERDRMVGVSRFEKQLEKEDAKYNAEMDKLDGIKPSKASTNLPPTSSTSEPVDPLHRALSEKQAEINSQTTPTEPVTPAAPPVETPQPAAPESQPAAQEWPKPTSQNSVKPAADPFKSTQPMTEEEKRAFGRIATQ